jgi:hypothetical protein
MSERERENETKPETYPTGARVKVPNIAAEGVVIGHIERTFYGSPPLVLVEIQRAGDEWLVGTVAVRYTHQLEATVCD